MAFAAPLVASCNFSRQYAWLIDVPIANEHLDSGRHCLIAGVSLGLASSPLRPQMFEFEHGGWCISIVSHDPSPSQCRLLISAPNMAVSGRPLGAIWAAYLFAPNKQAATWENGRGAQSFDQDQLRVRRIRQFDHGLAANLRPTTGICAFGARSPMAANE